MSGFAAIAPNCFGKTSANNKVRIGMIGCGERGNNLAGQFARIKDVAVVALCDPDLDQIASVAGELEKKGISTKGIGKFQDYRKLLEQTDIDAVAIASPNSWHTLHAIHAMEAGKDVYLEKPVTHDLWEGRQLLAAVEKYERIITAGFQSRSDPGIRDAIQFINEGNLGKILSIHVCCFNERDAIGKRGTPLPPPPHVDYNLWLGPAADLPILRPKFHYDWHWSWNTGNGDIGNQAVHEIEICNRILGDSKLPKEVRSFGGRFGWDDAGETPNIQIATYELGSVPVIIEVNNLKLSPNLNAVGMRDGIRIGVVARCEGGQLRGGLSGMYAVGEDGKNIVRKFPGNGGALHQENFIAAVRSRRVSDIPSSIVSAEKAAAIAHLSNLSFRTGSSQGAEAIIESFDSHAGVKTILTEQASQLAAWGIDKPDYTLGRNIRIDPITAMPITDGIDPELIRRTCRPEFRIPDLA